MKRSMGVIVLTAAFLLCVPSTKCAQNRQHPSLIEVADDPNLPGVLLIGDSISMGYTIPARNFLEGKANVHRPSVNCGPTSRGLEHLDKWLGDRRWAIIHFNWGLHDLKYVDAKGKLTSVKDGKQLISIEQYKKSLEKLVALMKKTEAKLIWATTTPVPVGSVGRANGDAAKCNGAAKEVMDRYEIPINDLYAYALPLVKKAQRPKNVHFTEWGSEMLAKKVAEVILQSLKE